MRLTLRVLAMIAGLLVCLPAHYLSILLCRQSRWPRRFLAWVGRCAGARCTIIGTPLQSYVLFVSNHLSWLDIMMLAGSGGATFVSKAEVADYPVIGWLAGLNRTIFVARSARNAVQNQADTLRAALQSGRPVALFPEGTTDGGETVLPFRASLLAALFPPMPNVKVQPVAIDYGAVGHEIAWVGKEPALANVKRLLSRRGTFPATLHFLTPVDPADVPDRKALASITRGEIVKLLDASAARHPPV